MDILLESLTTSQLDGWEAYYHVEPFGSRADNLRSGTVAMVYANYKRKKDQEPFTPNDFLDISHGYELTPEGKLQAQKEHNEKLKDRARKMAKVVKKKGKDGR